VAAKAIWASPAQSTRIKRFISKASKADAYENQPPGPSASQSVLVSFREFLLSACARFDEGRDAAYEATKSSPNVSSRDRSVNRKLRASLSLTGGTGGPFWRIDDLFKFSQSEFVHDFGAGNLAQSSAKQC
jgi:hypothetical protein